MKHSITDLIVMYKAMDVRSCSAIVDGIEMKFTATYIWPNSIMTHWRLSFEDKRVAKHPDYKNIRLQIQDMMRKGEYHMKTESIGRFLPK